MARCRCAEEACICTLLPGDGINIQGTGAPASPWVISAPPRTTGTLFFTNTPSVEFATTGVGTTQDPIVVSARAMIEALLEVLDTAEVNLTLSGAGTEADPLVLSADLPWVDPATGATGDVLTRQADGTFRASPVSVPAGTVFVGSSMFGDGTAANPLQVNLCTYAQLKAACFPP